MLEASSSPIFTAAPACTTNAGLTTTCQTGYSATLGGACTGTSTNTIYTTTTAPFAENFLGNSAKPRLSVGIGVNWNSPFGPLRIQRRNAVLMTKSFLIAGALIASVAAVPAVAQVNGIAVADPQGAIANTKAWAAARGQIQTTYKAQLDQAAARGKAMDAELAPLVTQFQAAQKAPGATNATLAPQYQAIQAKQQAGQAELARITAPAERAQAYSIEQIQARLPEAVQNVVKARNVSLLVSPQAVLFLTPAADITPAVTTELDRLVPSVSTAVPAGWQPGQQQAGAPAAAAPAAGTAPARPASARPTGR